jgi:serpin B
MVLFAVIPGIADNVSQAAVSANNAFTCRLYSELAQQDGNLFFSPFSISSALLMTAAGAQGETAGEMSRGLQLPGSIGEGVSAFEKALKVLKESERTTACRLSIANALWVEKTYKIQQLYRDAVEEQFDAGVFSVDFVHKADGVRQQINRWVSRRTGGLIRKLVGPGVLDAMTRLVLVNAIYFKGAWEHTFRKRDTRDQSFQCGNGTRRDVPMMHKQDSYGYIENGQWQILEMTYRGNQFSMSILLPRATNGMLALTNSHIFAEFSQQVSRCRVREVDVYVPRFSLRRTYDLKAPLRAMGMELPFGLQADFSGISGRKDLFISDVIHQAYVDVDEEGTEAAAATVVAMALTAMPPAEPVPVFRADHPFIFMIRHRPTGMILFAGRVVNP